MQSVPIYTSLWDAHLIHGQPKHHHQRHPDRFSRFAEITSMTDRPTDNATRSVTIGRIYVRNNSVQRFASLETSDDKEKSTGRLLDSVAYNSVK